MWHKKGDEGKSLIVGIRQNGSLWQLVYDFLQAYKDRTEALSRPPIGETSVAQKLDAIIAMLQPLSGVPGELGLVKEEIGLIHGLIIDGSIDPARLEALREKLKVSADSLKSTVESNQPKGE